MLVPRSFFQAPSPGRAASPGRAFRRAFTREASEASTRPREPHAPSQVLFFFGRTPTAQHRHPRPARHRAAARADGRRVRYRRGQQADPGGRRAARRAVLRPIRRAGVRERQGGGGASRAGRVRRRPPPRRGGGAVAALGLLDPDRRPRGLRRRRPRPRSRPASPRRSTRPGGAGCYGTRSTRRSTTWACPSR